MSKIKNKPILNEENILCEYGCKNKALFLITSKEKYCCSERYEKCPEQRKRNSSRQLGSIPWNKGLTKEDSRVNKNTKNTNIVRNQLIKDGNLFAWNKGLTKDDPRVDKYSKSMKISKTGVPNYKLRKPLTTEKYKSFSNFIYNFKGRLYTNWIFPILKRDNFRCTICESSIKLEVHHLKQYEKIYLESVEELKLNLYVWKNWSCEDISNLEKIIIEKHKIEIGKTVCELCHSVLDKHRRQFLKKDKKELLVEHERKYFRYKQL